MRPSRVGDSLQRIISTIIRDDFNDPELGMITVSAVDVTSDLSFAKIYITVLEDEKLQNTLNVLNDAAGFIRGKLGKQMTLRTVPKIKFIHDDTLEAGNRMESLLNSVKSPDE